MAAAPEPITKDVVVSGPGASSLTISGNDSHRVFNIDSTNNPEVKIEKLTLTKGRAIEADGGAILSASKGLLTTDSVTISASTATGTSFGIGRGGGILAITATVSNSTLSGNSAGSSGGGILSNTATVSNSIVAGNTALSNRECLGTFLGGFNIFGFSNNSGGCPTDNTTPAGALITILNPLDDNDGFSSGAPGSTVTIQTQSLPAGSPAINAGDPNFKTPPDFDQRGSGFPRIAGGRLDIGAFEVQDP